MKPGVIISFDVECSMGGAWNDKSLKPVSPLKGMMGRYGDRYYGIPLICEILEKNQLKATFFVEPFNEELGHGGETEPVCEYLLEKGHDIQLHIHPNHLHYGEYKKGNPYIFTDQMGELPENNQLEIIELGIERIEKFTGKRPVAFRAGNMGASLKTLKCLAEKGLWIDSSYTFPFSGGQCLINEKEPYNGAKWYGDVLELALSGFTQPKFPGLKPSKPFDLSGISFGECRDAVKKTAESGIDSVLILHSFSLFKVKDKQYTRARPDRIVTRRFEKFCFWLHNNREKYPPRTFEEFADLVKNRGYQPKASEPCRINRPLRGLLRRSVQLVNNIYWV